MTQLGALQLGITLGECSAIMREASCSSEAHPPPRQGLSQGARAGAELPGTVPAVVTWRPGMPEHLKVLQDMCSSKSLSERTDGQVSLLKHLPSGAGFSFAQVLGVCAHAADYLPVSSPA